MGRRNSGGWLILGLIGLGLFKCGETRTPTPPSTAHSPLPAVSQSAPTPVTYSPSPAKPSAPSHSLFAEPTANGNRSEPAAEARPIRSTLHVRGKEVPMRAAPDAKAKILNRLPNGMAVGELSRRDGWVEIRHPISALEGWVSARRLGETPPRTEDQPEPKRKEPPGVEVLSDAAIVARLITLDAAAYSGSCRCPENRDRAGRRCGARSAYSKPGGWSPLCYPGDVSREAIAAFRANGGR